ncbi:hypothetical protein CMQ_1257 [Grosmannia clavigera kw1407]|uniref:Transcription factor c2h2 n=1 Tax=Grosmannia clavigera (strain kw1407 / UAMH 11150) TaxID=655863 RepID=F0XE11_GROCL|nr:uncharacterized protein CMQ_1257 [Grosmannia clavigera kw1407]EFX04329.1 hypothetical protein CMQ_1257 [Grosmannia clavigera kw1407]
MASFFPDDLQVKNVHSQSTKSRIAESKPSFSAAQSSESSCLSEPASFLFGEQLLANCTAVALQFDPVFGMGNRSTYSTWPAIETSNRPCPDLGPYASDVSLSPPTGSRSVTASPPHYSVILTTQQREIKRQRDQARRESKLACRKRAGSNELSDSGILGIDAVASYTTSSHDNHSIDGAFIPDSSQSSVSSISIRTPALGASSPASFIHSPSVTMADLTSAPSASAMPVAYVSASASQISLVSEPVTTGPSGSIASAYLATAPYSPPMHGHTGQGLFSSTYDDHPYYSEVGYAHTAPASVHSQFPRSMQDQTNMMYHMSPPPQPPNALLSTGPMQQQPQQPQHQHPASFGQYTQPMPMHGNTHIPRQNETVPPGVRVVQSRPKPQCWEHGCNGRQFSTFSNLLRHQREKSGQAAKAVCPNCGAEFTRTTARNGHLAHDKCKPRRNS